MINSQGKFSVDQVINRKLLNRY